MREEGAISIDARALSAIDAHAVRDYPAECCGLLTVGSDGSMQVHACLNIQDRLHARDPVAHPRTSGTAYRMDDLAVARVLRDTESAGGRLVGVYHSHIDVGAYFSEEDQSAATFFGEPAYPGVSYLVVSVAQGKVGSRKGFAWDAATTRFAEVPISIVP